MALQKLQTGATSWPSILNSWLDEDAYTPTPAGVLNVTGTPTVAAFSYIRVGAQVIVRGKITVNVTATGTTEVSLTLPTASGIAPTANFANADRATGIAVDNVNNVVGIIESIPSDNKVKIKFTSPVTGNVTLHVDVRYFR